MISDSSDEENLDFLREAQDAQFINDSMFSDAAGKSTSKQTHEPLPSLRKSKDEEEQFNILKVTPEFRNYVAKQLSNVLDRKLRKRFVDLEPPKSPQNKNAIGGIRLLSDSKHYIEIPDIVKGGHTHIVHNIKAKAIKTRGTDKDVTEEILKQVVVSTEDILSRKEVKNWSTRSKAPVYRYKKTKNGQLTIIEPEFM